MNVWEKCKEYCKNDPDLILFGGFCVAAVFLGVAFCVTLLWVWSMVCKVI